MQGKVIGDSIVIMDSFALPVQGTETRVNAANEANEYMVTYIQECEKVRLHGTFPRSCKTDCCEPHSLVRVGQTTRERDRVVSFSSGLWVLVVWYRRRHPDEQSAIPRSFRGRRRTSGIVLSSTFLSHSRVPFSLYSHRSTPTARFQREGLTLVLSALTPKTILLQRLPRLNTNPSPSPRSKISVPTPINIINLKSKSSNPVWTRNYLGCCGTNTGSIH
jgi:hypothetical protein